MRLVELQPGTAVNPEHVLTVEAVTPGRTMLHLRDGRSLHVEVSYSDVRDMLNGKTLER